MKRSLYSAAKAEAARRDRVYKAFSAAGHPDAQALYSLHNKVVEDLVRDYKAAGGKRPVDQFLGEAL